MLDKLLLYTQLNVTAECKTYVANNIQIQDKIVFSQKIIND